MPIGADAQRPILTPRVKRVPDRARSEMERRAVGSKDARRKKESAV